MSGNNRATALRQRLDPTRQLGRLRRRAVEQGDGALEEAADQVESVADGIEDAGLAVGDLVRAVLRGVATVPSSLAWLLGGLAGLLDRLAESGREVAHRVEPPRAERRRRRLASAAWFTGGFGLGAAVGWLLHEQLSARGSHRHW